MTIVLPFEITASQMWQDIEAAINASLTEVNNNDYIARNILKSGFYGLANVLGEDFLRLGCELRTDGGEQTATIYFKLAKSILPTLEFYRRNKLYFPPDFNGVIWNGTEYDHGWINIGEGPITFTHQFPSDLKSAPYSSGHVQFYHHPISPTNPTPQSFLTMQCHFATVPAYYNSETDNLTYYTGWRDTTVYTGYHPTFTIPLGKKVISEMYCKVHESNGRIKHWYTIDGVRTLVYDIATSGSETGHNYPKVCTDTVPIKDDFRSLSRLYVDKGFISFPQYIYQGPSFKFSIPELQDNILIDSFPRGIPFTLSLF